MSDFIKVFNSDNTIIMEVVTFKQPKPHTWLVRVTWEDDSVLEYEQFAKTNNIRAYIQETVNNL